MEMQLLGDSMKLLIIAGFGGKLLDSSSYAQEERVKDAGLQLQFFYDNHICTLKLAQFPDVLYSYKPILEQLKFAEERVKDVDIQVSSHETSLVARCRRVYAHAHDYHINSISNNRHLKCKKLEESDYVQVGMNVAYMKSPLELLEESKVHMQKGNFIHQLSRFYANKTVAKGHKPSPTANAQ
ncbi:hypothetical protein P8452_51264 [Trifolium repens]|nr:hypothetical protein P8452_51264 [Trifolium repens]